MPAPTQLSIATSALNRLVKEESSYRREYEDQQKRIAKLESEAANSSDENAEYTLKQERQALDETKAMFPELKAKIDEAKSRLETQLEQDKGPGDQSSPEDVTKAKEAIASAMSAMRETS